MKREFPLSRAPWAQWLEDRSEPSFRLDQIHQWLTQHFSYEASSWLNIPKALRSSIDEEMEFPLKLLKNVTSASDQKTFRSLWETSDNQRVESVAIFARDRTTLCVSSQVGCGMKCQFCGTGTLGFTRNLTENEILAQFCMTANVLSRRPDSIVFMGMGEPLANEKNVIRAIELLGQEYIYAPRRITVSTCGLIPGINHLAEAGLGCQLAVSLTSAIPETREHLMPIERTHPLSKLIPAIENFSEKTNQRVTLECALVGSINTDYTHAKALARVAHRLRAHINLIPWNPVPGIKYHRPEREDVEDFTNYLRDKGLTVTCRYRKGSDISAACGQLVAADRVASSSEPSPDPAQTGLPVQLPAVQLSEAALSGTAMSEATVVVGTENGMATPPTTDAQEAKEAVEQ